MKYEWDEAKNRKNIAKHGLSFEDAEQVFSGPCVTFEDDRVDYGEQRLIALGLLAGRLVVLAHSARVSPRPMEAGGVGVPLPSTRQCFAVTTTIR